MAITQYRKHRRSMRRYGSFARDVFVPVPRRNKTLKAEYVNNQYSATYVELTYRAEYVGSSTVYKAED